MNSVLAVVVTYNPDIPLLEENLSALVGQVGMVAVYDNASENISGIRQLASRFDKVRLFENKENLGLPVNYNRAARYAQAEEFSWLLVMDQDTIIPEGLIEAYLCCSDIPGVAVLTAPMYLPGVDELEKIRNTIPAEPYTEVEECISSASLNRVDVLLALGGFDEKLFIDMVDFDYCKNARVHGYRVLQVNDCIITHNLSNPSHRRVLWRDMIISNYPAIRYYYIFRNRVYYARKYGLRFSTDRNYYRLFRLIFTRMLFEKDRLRKIGYVLRGVKDGFLL